MTDQFDRLLRSTLTELTSEARSVPLLEATRRKARAIRRRRRILAAGAVAGAAALTLFATLAAPALLARQDELPPGIRPTPSPSASPRTRPPVDASGVPTSLLELPGGYAVIAAFHPLPGQTGSYVWDRHNKRYVAVTADLVDPAPTGNLVQVGREAGYRIVDLPSGQDRTPAGMPSPARSLPGWSPDGRRLAYAAIDKEGGHLTYLVVDVAAGSTIELDLAAALRPGVCETHCLLTWHPNGDEVAMTVVDRTIRLDESQLDTPLGMQFFSAATGKPTRFVPIRGFVMGPMSWSPDGKYVIVIGTTDLSPQRKTELQVVTAAGDRIATRLGPPTGSPVHAWVDATTFLLQPTMGSLQLTSLDGKILDTYDLPTAFANRQMVIGKP